MTRAALIVAAGRGRRAATAGAPPKQYTLLGGKSILRRTIEVFAQHQRIDRILVVIHGDDRAAYDRAVDGLGEKLLAPVVGGATRQASVRLGLERLAAEAPETVLIHDAVRPFIADEVIDRVIAALGAAPGAIAALPVVDTLKEAGGDHRIARTVARDALWRAQTPQGFHFAPILGAHLDALRAGIGDMTDDAAIAEWAALPVALAMGSESNVKITTIEDLHMAEERLAAATRMETRVATGFDVHRFTDGDHVWLGGVRIAHTHKLEGHSDADVVLHALTDAVLGCIGEGDIGEHFPPSDPKWKGAASRVFLADAARRVAARGGRIVNVDVTVLAEAPKIGPHRAAMQDVIGAVLGLASDRVGIKATTTEGLGFTGRREGIAAMASATVMLPAAGAD